MTYLRDKKRNIKKLFLSTVVILVLVYVVLFTKVFDVASRNISFLAIPVWKTQNIFSSLWKNISIEFSSKKDLYNENIRLNDYLTIAGVKVLDRDLLYNENIKLKKLLGRKTINQKSVFANVVASPDKTFYDTIIIDAGENEEIKKGDVVLYSGNIAVGKVVKVFKNSSKVLLFSSPKEEINIVVGIDNIPVVAYGLGGGNFEFKIPRGTKNISIGGVILVSGSDMRVLGVIENIESKPSDPFKTVMFKGPVNIFKLKWVEIVVG